MGANIKMKGRQLQTMCMKGLHKLEGKNIKMNDGENGVVRQCRECKNSWMRDWRKNK